MRELQSGDQPSADGRARAMTISIQELAKCDEAVKQAIDRFLNGMSHPMDPIVNLVNKKFPLAQSGGGKAGSTPEVRESVYSETVRSMMRTAQGML